MKKIKEEIANSIGDASNVSGLDENPPGSKAVLNRKRILKRFKEFFKIPK